MAKNRKDEVPGASRGRGLVIIFGILDVFCAAFLVISLIASPGGPVSASVPVETLPAFEENLDHYGAAADNSKTYTSVSIVIFCCGAFIRLYMEFGSFFTYAQMDDDRKSYAYLVARVLFGLVFSLIGGILAGSMVESFINMIL